MTKGAKFIIIILAALFLGSTFLALQINTSKEALIQQYSNREKELRKKADELYSQLSSLQSDKKRLEDRWVSVKKDIDDISSQRDDWRKKYETALKEKEELIEKMRAIPKAVEKPAEVKLAPTDESFWADVLKEKAGLELQLSDLKSNLSEAAVSVEEAKKAKADIEVEITKIKQSNEDIEKKIKYSTDLANNLALDLAKEKNERKAVEARIAKLKEENLSLRYQIKELATSKVALGKGLQKLSIDKDNLTKRLQETEQVVQSRIDDVLQIKKDIEGRMSKDKTIGTEESKPIELPPIIVRSSTPSSKSEAIAVGLSGKIVSVDEANNFVIIDMGENAGVKVGNNFKVYRSDKQIASIEVIQTRQDISAADIKQKGQKIRVGDLVK